MTPVITGILSYEQGETFAISSVLSGKLLICGVYRYTAHPAKGLVTSSKWLVLYMFNLLCCYSNGTLKYSHIDYRGCVVLLYLWWEIYGRKDIATTDTYYILI